MRALLQRASRGEVRVAGESVGRIALGFVLLLGVGPDDDETVAVRLARKVAKLRVFGDENGKMNRSILDVKGEALVVSQFTLFADTSQGNRPGFSGAAPADKASALYSLFCRELEGLGVPVATGVFGADMEVELVNDGPVTLWLDESAAVG